MNRQIIFRGKRLDNGEWIYGSLLGLGQYSIANNCDHALVVASTIGQYTGLIDCNGTDIYEGDIVEITSYFTHPRNKVFARTKAEVEFYNGAFIAKHGEGIYHIANFLEDVEVIGNIHNQYDAPHRAQTRKQTKQANKPKQ